MSAIETTRYPDIRNYIGGSFVDHDAGRYLDVFNPADILWALATRMQPHADVSISPMMYKGNELDPSLLDEVVEELKQREKANGQKRR